MPTRKMIQEGDILALARFVREGVNRDHLANEGVLSMNRALADLVESRSVTKEADLEASNHKAGLLKLLS